jgi:heme/copper-type cytochrome/quinol oxidase subunit 3
MRQRLDVSNLPHFGFGSRSLFWWGTMGFVAIESTMMMLCFVSYFYLRGRELQWPPHGLLPDLGPGTVNLVLLVGSIFFMRGAEKACRRLDRSKCLAALVPCLVLALAALIVRVYEFRATGVRWDTHAYGSIVWTILSLHTLHIGGELIETGVLAWLLWDGPLEAKLFADVDDNSLYWYFITGIYVPVYAILYWAPRILARGMP